MGRMKVSAASGGKTITTGEVLKKPVAGEIPVGYRDLVGSESLVMGFRQEMFSVGSGKESGGVDCGAGCGTDFIILKWKDRTALVRGVELFRAWVKTFDPDAAKRIPDI